jgi:hypothetical protein
MKTIRLKHSVLAACAALSLAAPACLFAQTVDLPVQTFDSDASGTGVEWGTGAVAWTGAQGNPAGALLVTVNFTSGSDTPASDYICLAGGNPWWQPKAVDLATYKSVDFDIKWDNTSDITLAQFNDVSSWGQAMTNRNTGAQVMQGWANEGYLSGSLPGLDINVCGSYNQMAPAIASTNIPAAAAGGWTHVSIPVNPAQAHLGAVNGIVIHKWVNQQWGIANSVAGRFWIDNLVFMGNAAPPPPPTVSAPTEKAQPGLNIWLASANSAYDRQEVCSLVTNGLSWVGHATTGNPVTYSFTITGYPNSQNCQLFFLLSPNPAYMDNALDWNETNCVYLKMQGGLTNATMSFQYKINETGGQDMYGGGGIYTAAPGSGNPESGFLATVSPATGGVLGTWKVKFTSDTAVELIAPDNTTTNFTFPAYNAAKFAENPASGRPGVYVYLGGQMNTPEDAANQAFVFSDFSITGTPGAFSENFLTDTVLDTTNKWTKPGSAPVGTFIVPAADAGGLWLTWTLPAGGYDLQKSSTLNGGSLAWTSPTSTPIGMVGVVKQLVVPSELPAGDFAFFRLLKRTFTKLQILLPGMTAAPNTENGYTGTPSNQTMDSNGDYSFSVIVHSVDNDWNVVSSGTDSIHLTSSSGDFLVANIPADLSLSAGTVIFTVSFLTDGPASAMITAQDATDGTKTADTSPTVLINQ